MKRIGDSELILNADGSVYHLKLRPENISENILIVGDQGRVDTVSKHFSEIEFRMQNREFYTNTGLYKGNRITVLSTGIGTDNIDIVMNELDALVNIDLEKRCIKNEKTSLNIIRLGTSGALQEDIEVDDFVVSEYGLGLDGLLNFYKYDQGICDDGVVEAFVQHMNWNARLARPYAVKASEKLLKKIGDGMVHGITATASGFYGPQGRELRIAPLDAALNEKLQQFAYNSHRITNFEMETSALYGLGKILGHHTLTVCTIIANRASMKFSKDYHPTVERMITTVLDRLVK